MLQLNFWTIDTYILYLNIFIIKRILLRHSQIVGVLFQLEKKRMFLFHKEIESILQQANEAHDKIISFLFSKTNLIKT